MGSSGSVPWYNRPARPFPARVWLEARYAFRVSSSVFARQAAHPAARNGQRPFPAKVWLEAR